MTCSAECMNNQAFPVSDIDVAHLNPAFVRGVAAMLEIVRDRQEHYMESESFKDVSDVSLPADVDATESA